MGLSACVTVHEPVGLVMIAVPSRSDLVFTGAKGAVLAVSRFRPRVFAPAVGRAQQADPTFPTITPHDLRHTAASLAVSSGANVKAVQTMLGHASAVLTSGHLQRPLPGRPRRGRSAT